MFLVCTNEFILSFISLCSVLVYHGYTNANIAPSNRKSTCKNSRGNTIVRPFLQGIQFHAHTCGGGRHGIIAKVLDCRLEVSEFEPQSCYYIYFRINTLRKGIALLISSTMG